MCLLLHSLNYNVFLYIHGIVCPSWNEETKKQYILYHTHTIRRSQWLRGLRRRSVAARLLRLWVQIPPGAWMVVCCEWSGRGLCDELITHPEESYWLWCVAECDLETSIMTRPWPHWGAAAQKTNKNTYYSILTFKYIGTKLIQDFQNRHLKINTKLFTSRPISFLLHK